MEQSQTEKLAQVLADSIGPRLSGIAGLSSPRSTGSSAPIRVGASRSRREQYGTWRGWRHGRRAHAADRAAHAEPRGRAARVEPEHAEERAGRGRGRRRSPSSPTPRPPRQWLGTIRGKFVLVSAPELMCRAPQELERYARRGDGHEAQHAARRERSERAATRLRVARARGRQPQRRQPHRLRAARFGRRGGRRHDELVERLGRQQDLRRARPSRVPSVDLSCEDYGLLHRLATNKQGPRVRLDGGVAGDAGRGADVQRRRRAQGDGAA